MSYLQFMLCFCLTVVSLNEIEANTDLPQTTESPLGTNTSDDILNNCQEVCIKDTPQMIKELKENHKLILKGIENKLQNKIHRVLEGIKRKRQNEIRLVLEGIKTKWQNEIGQVLDLQNEIRQVLEESVDSAKLDDVIKPLLKGGQTNKCSPPKFKVSSLIMKYKTESGVYDIAIGNSSKKVFCDMITSGGGWTVIQKRSNKSVSFYRGWTEYEQGFGDAKGDYWLGNKFIHQLTSGAIYKLRIDLWDVQNKHMYAEYKTFVVGDSASKYKLTIAGYTGTAGDALKGNNGMKFTTFDQDNDLFDVLNCAKTGMGAWWASDCGLTGLNTNIKFVLFWNVGDEYIKSVMMIKRK